MVSEREIEAACKAFLAEYGDPSAEWWDYRKEVTAALEAAARVRAEDNAEGGEPEGELCKCAPAFHEHDEAGAKHCRSCDAEWHPAPQPSGMVKALEWKKPTELRFRAACTHFGYEYFIDQTPNGWLLQTYLLGDEYWETLGSYPALDDAMYAAQADYERRILAALTAGKPEPASGTDYFGSLVERARASATKASAKFPQPNYVTLKIAEEAGEVIRGAVHYAERRMEWSEVEGEIIQLLAMLIRFVTEGDQVNGIVPPTLPTAGKPEQAVPSEAEAERERIAKALEEEADTTPCSEDAVVIRDCARLVRANFSYREAERLASTTADIAAPTAGGGDA